jgi:hypothetical protein
MIEEGILGTQNHNFGSFDEVGRGLALFKAHLAAASAVMIAVMCWPPMENFTCASNPSIMRSMMRPTS